MNNAPKAATPPESLRRFQAQYSAHLRNPDQQPRPQNVPAERSEVYQTLLFNNICAFINACFPVAQQMLTQAQWLQLTRAFYHHWPCGTPYFSRIAYEMVQFVNDLEQQHQAEFILPEWLAELMHYEWIELQVETHPGQVKNNQRALSEAHTLRMNPTLANLSYRWPVHKIAPGHEPTAPEQTCLVVYRDSQDQVKFIEANPLTATLITLVEQKPNSAGLLLDALAELAPEIPYTSLLQFGVPLIEDLADRGVLMICENDRCS